MAIPDTKEEEKGMSMDRYHDENGARTRIDTRHLEWCRDNAPRRLAEEREEYDRLVAALAWAIRLAGCGFCMWFAIRHVGVIFRSGGALVELLGVILALAFTANTISDIWEGMKA